MKNRKILKAMIFFFIGMAACTYFAWQASLLTTAKVKTERVRSGSLVRKVMGTGRVQSSEKSFQSLPEGQKVAKVLLEAGDFVKKGDAVVQLELEYLDQSIREQKREVRQAELELKQQKLTAKYEAKKIEDSVSMNQEDSEMPDQESINKAKQSVQAEKRYQKQLSALQREGLELTLENQKDQLEKLEVWKACDGLVVSQNAGVLEAVGVVEGAITSGTEQIVLQSGQQEICGEIEEASLGLIKEGCEVIVSIQGEAEEQKIPVEKVGMSQEGKMMWYGKIPNQKEEKNYSVNTMVSYNYQEKTAGRYETLVPLSALREEQNAAYVLAAEVRAGILGDQYTAIKVPVTVLDQDEDYAAVEGAIGVDTLIVSESNKYVEAGDRIRLE